VSTILKDEPTYELKSDALDKLKSTLEKHSSINSIVDENGILIASFKDRISSAHVNKYCFENGITLTHLRENNQNLEKTFLELIK
jgi:ABC-2 type transport system ATP-binding protein